MSLRKNTPVKFSRPISSMRTVLQAVEQGNHTRAEIEAYSNLVPGKARSALYNLCFIGVVIRVEDDQRRSRYILPGTLGPVAKCLYGVRSIFDVR